MAFLTRLLIGLGLPMALAGAAVFLAWRGTREAGQVGEVVARTLRVLTELNAVQGEVSGASASARGFALTSDPMLLAQYADDRARALSALARLDSVLRGDPAMTEHQQALRRHVEERLGSLDRLVDRIDRGTSTASEVGGLVIEGHGYMAEVHQAIHDLEAAGESRLTERQARLRDAQDRQLRLLAGAGAVTLLATILAAAGMLQQWRARSAARRTLAEREEELRRIVQTAAEGILTVDEQWRVTFCNRRAADMLALPVSRIIGTPVDEVLGMDRDLAENTRRRRMGGAEERYELRLPRPDGVETWVQVTASPFIGADGTFHGALGMLLDITAQRRLRQRLEAEAMVDELTGLYNRRGFFSAAARILEAGRRSGRAVLVGSADLNGLKRVNDLHGHAAGDELIRAAADALRRTLRAADVIARLGGDEFVFLAEDPIPGLEAILRGRLDHHAAQYGADPALPYRLAFSLGFARSDEDGAELEALLAAADERMYAVKRRSGGGRDDGPPPSPSGPDAA